MSDVLEHNRQVWDIQSRSGTNRWCEPVSEAVIAAARQGDWEVHLTPNRPVPGDWFGGVSGKRVLCLASGGGQQAPVLAAAGARVTSLDVSEEQLAKDDQVARREGLDIELVQTGMADLSAFPDQHFDLIFHPVANVFAEAVRPVWLVCYRVLVGSGRLLAGFMNPDFFLFDHDAMEAGAAPEIAFRLPYSDTRDLEPAKLQRRRERMESLEFSHSLDDQLGGQLHAGFIIAGFYEDWWEDDATPLNAYMPTSMATLAIKQQPATQRQAHHV